jgi:hypothetical protein
MGVTAVFDEVLCEVLALVDGEAVAGVSARE